MTTTIEKRLEQIESQIFNTKNVLNLEEASWITGLSKSTLYKKTCKGEIPCYKKAKFLYFDRQELEAWMKSNPVKLTSEIETEASTYLMNNKSGGEL